MNQLNDEAVETKTEQERGVKSMISEDKVNPIVSINNHGKYTSLKILGIDISMAVSKVEYTSHSTRIKGGSEELGGNIVLNVNLELLVKILTTMSDVERDNVRIILEKYKKNE